MLSHSSCAQFCHKQAHTSFVDRINFRSAYVVYKEDSEVFGIRTYRYVIPESMFKAPYTLAENECFCTQTEATRDVCRVDGYLDMSSCSDGAPIAMSQVHFMGASKSLRNGVEGRKYNYYTLLSNLSYLSPSSYTWSVHTRNVLGHWTGIHTQISSMALLAPTYCPESWKPIHFQTLNFATISTLITSYFPHPYFSFLCANFPIF